MKRSLIAGASTLAIIAQMSVPAFADTITIKESATSTGKTYVYIIPSGESLAPISVAQYGSYYVLCTSIVGTTKTSKVLKIDTVNGSTVAIPLGTTDTLLDATAVGKYFCILSSNGTDTKMHVLDMSVGNVVEVVNTKSVANALAKLSDTEVTVYYADGTTEVRNLATGAYGATGAGLGVKDFDRLEGISFTPKFTATASYLGGTAFAGSADGKFYLYIKDANNTVPVSNTNTDNNNTGTNNSTNTGNVSIQTAEQAKAIISQNYNSISSIIGNSTSESTVKSYLLTGVTSKDIVINTYNPQITRATSSKKGTFKLTAIVSSATNAFSPVTYNINQSIPKLNSSSSSSSSSSSGNVTDDMKDAEDKIDDWLDDYNPSNKSQKSNILEALKSKVKKYDVKIKIEDWDLDEADKNNEGNLSFTVKIIDEDDKDNYIEIDYDEDFDKDDRVDSIDKKDSSSSSSSSSTSETATNKVTSSSSSNSITASNSSTATNKVNTSNVISTANTATNASKNGWINEGGKWAYYENNTKAYNKWVASNGAWYYINTSGTMATGWQQAGGKWYYLDDSGKMITGWKQLGGRWYLFEESGSMATGWKQSGGKWYFLNTDGSMATGWKQSGGKWYYLDSSGKMLTNTIVGGYKLGPDGAMK